MGLDEPKAREGAWRGRPGRHGVAVASRWPSSASTPWIATRGEAERLRSGTGAGLGEPRDGEAAWPGGRRVAGGLAHGRRWTGEGERAEREEREREKKDLIPNLNFSPHFLLKHRKL